MRESTPDPPSISVLFLLVRQGLDGSESGAQGSYGSSSSGLGRMWSFFGELHSWLYSSSVHVTVCMCACKVHNPCIRMWGSEDIQYLLLVKYRVGR